MMRLTGVPATAPAIAAQRMLESRRPDRLFEDPQAEIFDFKEDVLRNSPPSCARFTLSADLAGDWASSLETVGFGPEGLRQAVR
jgi:O-methyltransferase involved in polyketide biosynthesis